MTTRIQPSEIEIPPGDPFKNDLLERKQPAEILTNLVANIEGPCVLAVDAAWGAGKTTFTKMWSQYLRNKEFPVIEFNAWETDFSEDPFAALCSDLIKGLGRYTDNGIGGMISNVKDAAQQFAIWTQPVNIRLGTAGSAEFPQSDVAELVRDKYRLSAYEKAKEAVREFRDTLQGMAQALSDETKHPLIVVVDELDRCRPTYAVELLEVAKHLFSVDHIVFVLAVNRSQLEHSVQALYGSGFDAKGYLRRFFDVDFRLPEPQRSQFIEALLQEMQCNHYLKGEEYNDTASITLKVLLDSSGLSLRQIAQSIHRLGLVLASLKSNQPRFALPIAVALILRTIDAELYHRFCAGYASDKEVVEKVGEAFVAEKTQSALVARCNFEAVLIAAQDNLEKHNNFPATSSLYLQNLDREESSVISPERDLAQRVVGKIRNWKKTGLHEQIGDLFRESVRRIELLSPSLDGLGENR